MAAQSARDRKKMRMLDLESENDRLNKERLDLIKRNRYLEQKLKLYETENESLRKKLGIEPMKFDLKIQDDDQEDIELTKQNLKKVNDDILVEDYGSDDSSRSSDYYSSSSSVNTIESAELINVPLPKDQVLKTTKEGELIVTPEELSNDQINVEAKQPTKTLDKNKQETKICSLQQLTSFLMIMLATITLNSNQSSIINLLGLLNNIFSMNILQENEENNSSSSNNNKLKINPNTSKMDLEFSNCLSNLANQSQLNMLIQQCQKKVRLRM